MTKKHLYRITGRHTYTDGEMCAEIDLIPVVTTTPGGWWVNPDPDGSDRQRCHVKALPVGGDGEPVLEKRFAYARLDHALLSARRRNQKRQHLLAVQLRSAIILGEGLAAVTPEALEAALKAAEVPDGKMRRTPPRAVSVDVRDYVDRDGATSLPGGRASRGHPAVKTVLTAADPRHWPGRTDRLFSDEPMLAAPPWKVRFDRIYRGAFPSPFDAVAFACSLGPGAEVCLNRLGALWEFQGTRDRRPTYLEMEEIAADLPRRAVNLCAPAPKP